MCQAALNIDTGEELNSVADLLRATNGLIVYANGLDARAEVKPESCLCVANLPQTLVEAGYKVWRNPDVLPEYLFEAVPLSEAKEA
jgi:hypothetical protein